MKDVIVRRHEDHRIYQIILYLMKMLMPGERCEECS